MSVCHEHLMCKQSRTKFGFLFESGCGCDVDPDVDDILPRFGDQLPENLFSIGLFDLENSSQNRQTIQLNAQVRGASRNHRRLHHLHGKRRLRNRVLRAVRRLHIGGWVQMTTNEIPTIGNGSAKTEAAKAV